MCNVIGDEITQFSNTIVVGGGIVGLSTAYFLQKAGIKTTLIVQGKEVADATSYANGGHFGLSECAPWTGNKFIDAIENAPDRDAGMFIANRSAISKKLISDLKFYADPSLRELAFRRNIELTLLTLDLIKKLGITSDKNISPDSRSYCNEVVNCGNLRIFSSQDALNQAQSDLKVFEEYGITMHRLDKSEIVENYPGLKNLVNKEQFLAAIFSPLDAICDAAALCFLLCQRFQGSGGRIIYQKFVNKIEFNSEGNVDGLWIKSSDNNFSSSYIKAKSVVLATGSSTNLVEDIYKFENGYSADLPIFPLKGYSITIPYNEKNQIADQFPRALAWAEKRLVYSRYKNRIRVAGLLEIGDLSSNINEQRLKLLIENTSRILGKTIDVSAVQSWCGFRPMSVDGSPIIGLLANNKTKNNPLMGPNNLFINNGYGPAGVAMGLGGGYLLAKQIATEKVNKLIKLFTPIRFFSRQTRDISNHIKY